VNRLVERGTSRAPAIGIDQLPRAVQRLAEREDGVARSAPPIQASGKAKQAETRSHQGGPDMRSALVRKVVEMAKLQRSQDLETAAREQATRAPEAGAGAKGESIAGATLEQWYEDMKASGLSEPEIEEHMSQRLRSVRNAMLEFEDLRSVGGER
jgi:hypothetical protein